MFSRFLGVFLDVFKVIGTSPIGESLDVYGVGSRLSVGFGS